MRVVHLDTGRELRGGQRQALLLARELHSRGYSQVLLARRGGALLEAASGLEARPITARAILQEARRADLLHAHDARSHSLATLAAGACPLVVSRRVAFPVGEGVLSRWKYGRASRYLAVSEFVKAQLLAAGVPEERLSVVYDGVDVPPAVCRERRRVAVAPKTGDPAKGSALAEAACRAAGVELRFSQDLENDLEDAAVFLYLSYSEGLGSAILLAMAKQTPVIASRVGGIPEIVEHGRTGLLVENNVESVGRAVREVLQNPADAERRAAAACQTVASRFSVEAMVRGTEAAYEAVAAAAGRARA
jgi:hypothetical protein